MCHMRRRMHLSFEDTCGFRSTWYLCPPYHCPRTRRVGVGESLLGPCSLLMGALDASKNIRTSLPPLHPPSLSVSLSLSLSLCFGASHIHHCRNATDEQTKLLGSCKYFFSHVHDFKQKTPFKRVSPLLLYSVRGQLG